MDVPQGPSDQPTDGNRARRSPLLQLDGAVEAAGVDAGVAAHYGDPIREQRRLEQDRTGFVDLSHREIIELRGADRLELLHALTTQDLQRIPPNTATTALVLSPQGRIEHAIYGVDDGEVFRAHVEPGTAAAVIEFFDSMRFLMRVELADVTESYALVAEPTQVPAADDDVLVRAGADSLLGGRELFLPRERLSSYAAEHGPAAGIWAYEALRIAAYQPRFGSETDHKSIPNELGWLDAAVALEKGCYRGQETVARIHNLGRPPRRLVFLQLDGSADRLPEHGAPVSYGSKQVGTVTSTARHHELGPIGLAVVKRNTPTDVDLDADGVAAAQEVVVHPEIGLHFKPAL